MQTDTPSATGNRIRLSKGERAISITGGALLLSSGLGDIRNSPVSAFIKALAGGYLIYRGASGQCPIQEFISKTMAQMSSAQSPVMEDEPESRATSEPAENAPAGKEGTTDYPEQDSPDEDRPTVAHG